MKKSNLRARPLNMTIGMIMLVYILVTIMAYSVFSLDATKFITFPTFELAKEIEVPGAFFERLESLMMTVWIMTIFNTMTMCHFLAYFILKDEILKNKNHSIKKRGLLLPSVLQIVIFIGAFIPNSFTEASALSDWIARLGTALFLISLSSGYLTLWIRRQRKKTEAT